MRYIECRKRCVHINVYRLASTGCVCVYLNFDLRSDDLRRNSCLILGVPYGASDEYFSVKD